MIDTVVKKYQEWKIGMDDGCLYDSIDDFFSSLSRGELLSIINYLTINQ